jgi:hypothetical protein
MGVPEEKIRWYRRIVDARVYSTVSSRLFFGPVFLAKVIVFLGRQAGNQGAIIPGSWLLCPAPPISAETEK